MVGFADAWLTGVAVEVIGYGTEERSMVVSDIE